MKPLFYDGDSIHQLSVLREKRVDIFFFFFFFFFFFPEPHNSRKDEAEAEPAEEERESALSLLNEETQILATPPTCTCILFFVFFFFHSSSLSPAPYKGRVVILGGRHSTNGTRWLTSAASHSRCFFLESFFWFHAVLRRIAVRFWNRWPPTSASTCWVSPSVFNRCTMKLGYALVRQNNGINYVSLKPEFLYSPLVLFNCKNKFDISFTCCLIGFIFPYNLKW